MTKSLNRARMAVGVLPLAALVVAAGCSRDQLLNVQTPDIISTGSANSAAGAQAMYAAAIGNFARFFGGDSAGFSPIGVNLSSGMLADEIFSARSGTEHMDQRNVNNAVFPSSTWNAVGIANTQIIRAIQDLNKYPPASATTKANELTELYALNGIVYTITGEVYCNGVPISDGALPAKSSVTLSNADLFNKAAAQFDSALAQNPTDTRVKYLAQVGKGRALLDLGQTANAAAAVAGVPTSFVYNATYSKFTTGIENVIYSWMLGTRNFGASDKEGTNGLDFVSSGDPRIKVDGSPAGMKPGQDRTPTPTLLQFPSTDAPIPVASGYEARMIEAENQLANNDPNWLVTLNAARASFTGGTLAPLVDPGTADGRVNLVFRERAFWMYMTAHRLGDLRRLVRQYKRNPETVFPTGNYFKGGTYGADVNLVPSNTELNNPDWKSCTDRNA